MKNSLEEARLIINDVDKKMIELFKKRMEAANLVANYKKIHNLPILDGKRETALKERNIDLLADKDLEKYYLPFLEKMLEVSKSYQEEVISKKHFALLGHPLGHSISPQIHSIIFKALGLNASYELKDINENDLEEVLKEMKNGQYDGFNVTIPYKIKIMEYLDELSPEAEAMQAVNTVLRKNGKLIGYNTDYYGFYDEIIENNIDVYGKTIYILGTGGASHAVSKALKDLHANVIIVSRKKTQDTITYDELARLEKIDGIVNTTPVGMCPNVNDSPIPLEVAKKANFIIDVIFNPKKTKLMSYNDNSYNGLDMLIYQAIKAEEIWHNKSFDKKELYNIIRGALNE